MISISDHPISVSSPFSKHLFTNYLPSDDEIVAIKCHIALQETQFGEVCADTNQLEAAHDQLRSLSKQLTDSIAAHRSLIAPARLLPDDVLEEIFFACLPAKPAMTKCEAPMLLSHICRRWRIVSLATPWLWSHIHIPFSRGMMERSSRSMKARIRNSTRLVQEWVKRAGNLDRSLTMGPTMDVMRKLWSTVGLVQVWMAAFLRIAQTCKVIEVQSIFTKHDSPILKETWNLLRYFNFSRLESLKLQFICCGDVPVQLLAWDICPLLRAPNLRHLSIHPLIDQLKRSKLPICWPGLISLDLTIPVDSIQFAERSPPLPCNEVAWLLSQCRLLKIFKVELGNPRYGMYHGAFEEWPVPFRTTLQYLEELSITTQITRKNFPKFASHISFPSLTSLDLNVLRNQGAEVNLILSVAAERMGPLLKTLKLVAEGLDQGRVLDALAMMPCLEQFSLQHFESETVAHLPHSTRCMIVNDELLIRLSPPPNANLESQSEFNNQLCPRLQSFEWTGPHSPDFSDRGLLNFIRSKNSSSREDVKPLLDVNVVFNKRTRQLDVAAELGDLARTLELRLSYAVEDIDYDVSSLYA